LTEIQAIILSTGVKRPATAQGAGRHGPEDGKMIELGWLQEVDANLGEMDRSGVKPAMGMVPR